MVSPKQPPCPVGQLLIFASTLWWMGMAAASSNSDATAGSLDVRAAGVAGAYVGATARTRDRTESDVPFS